MNPFLRARTKTGTCFHAKYPASGTQLSRVPLPIPRSQENSQTSYDTT